MSARTACALAVAAALAAAAGAAHAADAPPAGPPRSLVVALGLENTALQAGVLRGRDVILARGFEVELARILARRLGGRVDRFVHVASPERLLAATPSGWHLALAAIEPRRGVRAAGEPSEPYATTDVAVVARRGLRRIASLADLRTAVLCAARGDAAARRAVSTVRPRRPPVWLAGDARLRTALRTGACDAALVPAVEAGRFVAGHRPVLGPVLGRIRQGEGLVALVARGTGLEVGAVNRELRRLRRDGTLGRLARTWLGLDPAGLRVLR